MGERRLGRGLDYLIPATLEENKDSVSQLAVDLITKNRFQPREHFNEDSIQELALSIKENGVIQPILVRREDNRYELIAGERRLKACRELGLDTIPCVVLDVSDDKLLEFALVENIQREDLNAIEESRALHMFVKYNALTHEEIAKKIGKHRTYVTNALRLLELPEKIQVAVSRGTISAGHARALLGISDPEVMLNAFEQVVADQLTVRKTESLVKKLNSEQKSTSPSPATTKEPYLTDLEEKLRDHFNSRVDIQINGKKGKISFSFHSEQDLSRLIELLTFHSDERSELSESV